MIQERPMRRLTLVFCAGGLLIGCVASLAGIPGVSADDSATSRQPKGPFPFFAMNFAMHDARFSSPTAQADLLKELGYDGLALPGRPGRAWSKRSEALDATASAACSPPICIPMRTSPSIPDSPKYDPRIKEMIRRVERARYRSLLHLLRAPQKHSADPRRKAMNVPSASWLEILPIVPGKRACVWHFIRMWAIGYERVRRCGAHRQEG